MNNKLKTYQEIFGVENWNAHFSSGFNSRVFGSTLAQTVPGYYSGDRQNGWWLADEMARKGEIYTTEPFEHNGCKSLAFTYGGTWACNGCNCDHIEQEWWKVKIMKDGDQYCVVGEGFVDLQESDNYAFGFTREEALQNYANVMLNVHN